MALLAAAVPAVLVLGCGRQRTRSRRWVADAVHAVRQARDFPAPKVAGVAIWTVLVLAIAVWDVFSFVHQAHDLPTLSYYIGKVTRYDWGRGVCFATWLCIGAWLIAGWRRAER